MVSAKQNAVNRLLRIRGTIVDHHHVFDNVCFSSLEHITFLSFFLLLCSFSRHSKMRELELAMKNAYSGCLVINSQLTSFFNKFFFGQFFFCIFSFISWRSNLFLFFFLVRSLRIVNGVVDVFF